ncbi:MAG TPA: DUF2283 domain-containing protein [Pirellulales bacterium]|jgi:uncharacterized protein YuzE|nr:DUF2283 domain-containing protein [Pirellulales bacterium]
MRTFSFNVNVETRTDTGEVLAVYFRFRDGKSAKTREFADGNVFADYDRGGSLLGIELLAPCSLAVLERIVRPVTARRFVRQTIPSSMLAPA